MHKTAYEMRISDWSSDVCSADLIKVGEEVEIVGIHDTRKTTVTGVEMFRKLLDQGQAGDNVGALIRGVGRDEVERGQVLAKPGSITPHTDFKSEVYVLSKDEGGRHTPRSDERCVGNEVGS